MRNVASVLLISLLGSIGIYAQVKYAPRIETAYLWFQNNTIDVDPGPGWKGHYLGEGDNGFQINIINGAQVNKVFFAGIGTGYQNYSGMHGLTIFADIEFMPLNTKLKPLFYMETGYNHLWNQYSGGTGTALFGLGGGLAYQIDEKRFIAIKSGFYALQQSLLVPLVLEVGF